MKIKNFFLSIFLVNMMIFCFSVPTLAETPQTGADFSVDPIYPENQIKAESGYFHLGMTPGKTQTIEVEITNHSNKENTVLIERYRSTTNDNGQISYREYKQEAIKDMPVNFEDIVKVENKSVTIAPNDKVKIPITIKMPDEPLEGMILGGLRFYQENPDLKNKSGIVNTFSYSIPVLLTEEKSSKVKNKLSLVDIKPVQRNGHPYIETTLENNAPTIVEKLVVDGKIYVKGQKEPIYVKKESNLEMAPYSLFNLGFDLYDSFLESGKYHLVLNVTADEENYTFEDDFEVTNKESKIFNENSVYTPEKETPYYLYVIALVVVVLIIALVIKKNNDKKKSMKIKKKKKKSKSKSKSKKNK